MKQKKDLHKNRFLKIPSHKSTPSSTWEAISGGMRGDGGPIIRSSPTKIVSSIVGSESTKLPKDNNKLVRHSSLVNTKIMQPLLHFFKWFFPLRFSKKLNLEKKKKRVEYREY